MKLCSAAPLAEPRETSDQIGRIWSLPAMASIDRHDEGFIGHGGTAPRTKSQQMRSTIFDNQWPEDTRCAAPDHVEGVSSDAMAAAAAFGHTRRAF